VLGEQMIVDDGERRHQQQAMKVRTLTLPRRTGAWSLRNRFRVSLSGDDAMISFGGRFCFSRPPLHLTTPPLALLAVAFFTTYRIPLLTRPSTFYAHPRPPVQANDSPWPVRINPGLTQLICGQRQKGSPPLPLRSPPPYPQREWRPTAASSVPGCGGSNSSS
jgi:hypothetical protein